MALRVSGKNMNIGEALRTHVTDRIRALTEKYFDGGVSGHVTIEPEGAGYRTDCSLHLTSGILLQADGRAQDPYGAFDQSAQRIEKRLRRYKNRLKSHHDHDAGKVEIVPSYLLEAPDQEFGGAQRVQCGGDRGDDDAAAPPLGVAGRARPRPVGGPRRGLSARLDRKNQRGLPPQRSPYRMD